MIIYRITNTVNNKFYIGKTTKSLEERFLRHKANHKHGKTYLYKAMRKHGVENFKIEALELTEDLDARERFWISELAPEYNMTAGGDGGDTSHSPNFKEAMKRRAPPKPTYGMKGKKQSDNWHEAIKESNSCAVMCNGTRYESVSAAQKANPGISIRRRIDSQDHPLYYRLGQKISRK